MRDRQLGRFSPDLDVAVADDPAAVAVALAKQVNASWFPLSTRHGAFRVMGRSGHVDVARLRGDSIEEDLAERDFTINAMALSLPDENLIDPFGGMQHLREGRLVPVGPHIFAEDPLRLMRAVRFCHVLGFRLDPALENLVRAEAAKLARSAPERVAMEMSLTLAERDSAAAVARWWELGLLPVFLPEAIGKERGGTTGGAPLDQILRMLNRLDEGLLEPAAWFPAAAPLLKRRLAVPVDGVFSRPVALRVAAMLRAATPLECRLAGRRLRLSNDLVSLIETAARSFSAGWGGGAGLGAAGVKEGGAGLGAGGVEQAGARLADDDRVATGDRHGAGRVDRRAAILFLWACAPWEPETILLGMAAGEDEGVCRELMALWVERASGAARPLPIDGNDLMRTLGLKEGPGLGRLLREVRLAWEAGDLNDREDCLRLARELASPQPDSVERA
ncbi:MAG: CCA tRNA nucleotidyltransferase [Thermoleophilia bacterium]|nr:CCA tRNA nucleotidyltransferase [Thermoleophilia bacterium]